MNTCKKCQCREHSKMQARDTRGAGLPKIVTSFVQLISCGEACPGGLMDKASVSGAEDCGFESHPG